MQIRTVLSCFLLLPVLASLLPSAMSATVQKAGVTAPISTLIDAFTVRPVNKTEPGTELSFWLSGTPYGKASVSIDDVVKELPLQETQPGIYEGTYTIRSSDNMPGGLNATAVLQSGVSVAQSRLAQASLAESKPLVAKNVSPRDGETVVANPVLISATFDDASGIAIDTKTVCVLVAGNDVTRNAAITPQFFSYRTALLPGTYAVEVSAKDVAGRAMRHSWSFNVAKAAVPVETVLPLQITSHVNNAQVGAESIEIRGRTAADAQLEVQVQAVASVAGFISLSQKIFTQTMKADANGNFDFVFPPKVTVAGTRYEVVISAKKADLTKELKLNLFQQK